MIMLIRMLIFMMTFCTESIELDGKRLTAESAGIS